MSQNKSVCLSDLQAEKEGSAIMKDFDIRDFDEYKEDNRREVKKAKGGLPHSLWETYSSMCNTYGGVIICGVVEHDDHTWETIVRHIKRSYERQIICDGLAV